MRKAWTDTTLGLLVSLETGKLDVNASVEGGEFPFFTCSRETYTIDIAAYSGKSVVVAGNGDLNVKYYEGEFNAYQRTYILQAINESILNPIFLFHFMDKYVETLRRDTQGSTIQYLKKAQFTEAPVALPPLAEQRRIVDIVSSVDAYIDALQQQVDTARAARNAVLHELLSAGGDNWTETTLGKISQLVSRGRAPSYCDDDGVVVLNQKCVRYGRIFFEFARRTDSTKKTIPEWAYLKVGDTLINSTGVGTLGRASFVSCLDGPTTFDSHVTLVRPRHDSSFPEFIGMTLNLLENEIEMFAGGSTGQTELSREAVNSFPVSLPPLEEQKRIVEIVSSMDDVIQATEQSVVNARNLRSGLLSDLLSGEHEIPKSFDKFFGTA